MRKKEFVDRLPRVCAPGPAMDRLLPKFVELFAAVRAEINQQGTTGWRDAVAAGFGAALADAVEKLSHELKE